MFRKYSEIENHTRQKTVDNIRMIGADREQWVQTLKVHGSNYSLWYDGENVRRGKRSALIANDAIFHGDDNFDYTENVKKMWEHLKSAGELIESIAICGEIYGGFYPHPNVPNNKKAVRVQKEVAYTPDDRFIVFDIMINGIYIPFDRVIQLSEAFGFVVVPVLAVGSFDDLLKNTVTFEDPLHKLFGLPTIENNNAEGWVMKPWIPRFFNTGERVILKGKSEKFSERKVGKPNVIHEIPEEEKNLQEAVSSFITENRLRNVLSHIETENLTHKDFGNILKLFVEDIMKDYSKDEIVPEDKKELHLFRKFVNLEASKIIRTNFVKIIDKNF